MHKSCVPSAARLLALPKHFAVGCNCVQLTRAQDMWISLMDSATFLLDFDNQSAVRIYCGKVGKTSRRSELLWIGETQKAWSGWTRMSRGFKSPRFQPKTHNLSDVLYNTYVTYAKIRSFLRFSQRSRPPAAGLADARGVAMPSVDEQHWAWEPHHLPGQGAAKNRFGTKNGDQNLRKSPWFHMFQLFFGGCLLFTSNFWDDSRMLEAFSIWMNDCKYRILIYLRYIYKDTTE